MSIRSIMLRVALAAALVFPLSVATARPGMRPPRPPPGARAEPPSAGAHHKGMAAHMLVRHALHGADPLRDAMIDAAAAEALRIINPGAEQKAALRGALAPLSAEITAFTAELAAARPALIDNLKAVAAAADKGEDVKALRDAGRAQHKALHDKAERFLAERIERVRAAVALLTDAQRRALVERMHDARTGDDGPGPVGPEGPGMGPPGGGCGHCGGDKPCGEGGTCGAGGGCANCGGDKPAGEGGCACGANCACGPDCACGAAGAGPGRGRPADRQARREARREVRHEAMLARDMLPPPLTGILLSEAFVGRLK